MNNPTVHENNNLILQISAIVLGSSILGLAYRAVRGKVFSAIQWVASGVLSGGAGLIAYLLLFRHLHHVDPYSQAGLSLVAGTVGHGFIEMVYRKYFSRNNEKD